jgi:hypothetical protein
LNRKDGKFGKGARGLANTERACEEQERDGNGRALYRSLLVFGL